MKREIIKRIRDMEKILDNAEKKIKNLEKAITEFEDIQPKIQELEAYYTGDDWKEDYALDEEGKLPENLKRGVLSEDGIYDLLEKNKEFLSLIEKD